MMRPAAPALLALALGCAALGCAPEAFLRRGGSAQYPTPEQAFGAGAQAGVECMTETPIKLAALGVPPESLYALTIRTCDEMARSFGR